MSTIYVLRTVITCTWCVCLLKFSRSVHNQMQCHFVFVPCPLPPTSQSSFATWSWDCSYMKGYTNWQVIVSQEYSFIYYHFHSGSIGFHFLDNLAIIHHHDTFIQYWSVKTLRFVFVEQSFNGASVLRKMPFLLAFRFCIQLLNGLPFCLYGVGSFNEFVSFIRCWFVQWVRSVYTVLVCSMSSFPFCVLLHLSHVNAKHTHCIYMYV